MASTPHLPASRGLDALFAPRSIAVVGASHDIRRIRGRLLKLLIDGGFGGPVHPVNPSRAQIQGLRAYPSVRDLPEPVDLALIAVAADQVMEVLAECEQRGVRAAAVLSAGANGVPVGERLQDQVAAFARRTGIRVLGPNAEGFIDATTGLLATFSPTIETLPPRREDGTRGGISIVSQSGAMAFALYSRAHAEHVPVRHLVSTGNESDVELLEVVDHLIARGGSRAILLFVEGLHHPERLAPVAARAADAGVPLVVAKVGRSTAGQRAAVSHTAHLTGADTAYDAAFRRHGVIRVDDPEQMLAVAAAASAGMWPQGRRVAIVTTSGGAGGWAADICEQAGLDVPAFDEAFKRELARVVPDYGSTENPVDVTARVAEDGGSTLLAILARLGEASGIDIGLVIMSLVAPGRITSIEPELKALMAQAKRPLLFHSPGAASPDERAALARVGTAHVELRSFAFAMRALDDYRLFRERRQGRHGAASTDRTRPAMPRLAGQGPLDIAATRALLDAWHVPMPPESLATQADEAVRAAEAMGWPVVLKIASPDIAHKTEAGGVALDLRDADAVRTAFERVMASVAAKAPCARIDGIQVQKMMPPGREMVVGTVNDPDFGPMVMLGLGGIYVEVLRDVVFALAPLDAGEARGMVDRLAARALLDGVRGQPAADVDALVGLLVAVSELAAAGAGEIAEMDLNPVLVYPAGQGAVVVDALIVPQPPAMQAQDKQRS
ncbi:acetate--CoA ligase family protein [Aquincola sp. MAHUQ-54]|uniref:Acetate--CoA ligase family protein n=1 Tax=Aquincola agrisoli TaxID=3119538 RepID=A0AAW9QPD7_9BURK